MPEPDEPAPLLLGEWSAEVVTRNGIRLQVRPAAPEDATLIRSFYASLGHDDLRFRFLTPLVKPSTSLLESLVDVDHVRTEDFLAFVDAHGTHELVATAMLAADEKLERAEVAIAVRPDRKGEGIGWSLLDFIAHDAAARGIRTLESIECSDNRVTIELELESGFTAVPYPDDPSLTLLTKRLIPPSGAFEP